MRGKDFYPVGRLPFDEKREVVFFYAHHGVLLENLWSRVQQEDPACRQMDAEQLNTFFSENERILNLRNFPQLIGMNYVEWIVIDTYLPEKQILPETGRGYVSCLPGIYRGGVRSELSSLCVVHDVIPDHAMIVIMAIRDIN